MSQAKVVWGVFFILLLLCAYAVWIVGYATGGFIMFEKRTVVKEYELPAMIVEKPTVLEKTIIVNNQTVIERPVPVEKVGDCIIINGDRSGVYCK